MHFYLGLQLNKVQSTASLEEFWGRKGGKKWDARLQVLGSFFKKSTVCAHHDVALEPFFAWIKIETLASI